MKRLLRTSRPFGKRLALLTVAGVLAAAPVGSQAAKLPTGRIIAVFGNAGFPFATPRVVIQPGGTVTFTNLDVTRHDVTANSGLFRSALIGVAQSTPVVGGNLLKPGTYAFHCSIHPAMKGSLIVKKL